MLSTSKLSGIKISKKRLFATSILGGIFSLIILFNLTNVWQITIKLLMGLLLILIGFIKKDSTKQQITKLILYFTTTNLIYAGIMFSIYIIFAPNIMAYKNGVVYFNITALNLVFSTVIAYISINIIIRTLDKKINPNELAQIQIFFLGREVILTGLIDTGNKLTDIFTGLPVIVCEYDKVCDLFPNKLKEYFKTQDIDILSKTSYVTKIKLIPIKVVGYSTILPAFKPDKVIISNINTEVIIAITNERLSNGEFSAIINSSFKS